MRFKVIISFLALMVNIPTINAGTVFPDGEVVVAGPYTDMSLKDRLKAADYDDYASLRSLTILNGTLTQDDCSFIRKEMPSLSSFRLEGSADFVDSRVPKGAFEGMTNLEEVYIANTMVVSSKAFSLCSGLKTVEMPNVKKLEVQAFAQAKGSGNGQLQVVKMPSLEEMEPRVFYYCVNLKDLYLGRPPLPTKPEGKEGLWFERVTKMVIHVPSAKVFNDFVDSVNCTMIDWSAYDFCADNGDVLPEISYADEFEDSSLDYLRGTLLDHFDRSRKDYSGQYYSGDFKLSLNLYTFNMNLNASLNESGNVPQINTAEAIRWAAKSGFDAVDITCYYIQGYSNTDLPKESERDEILARARALKVLCDSLGLEVSGTGLQNNFADPNAARRRTDVERIKFWLEVASELGAPVIRIFAGPPPADIRRSGWQTIARDRIVPCVQEVADYAAKNYPEVKIGVQNHGCMLSTANQVIQLLKWVDRDNVGIVNDTGFYRDFLSTDATKYDWYRDIALVLPYSNNFQIKKKPAGAETSELMDLTRLVYDIRKSPYRGYLPIELLWVSKDDGYPGDLSDPPFDETLRFLDKLKRAIEITRNMVIGEMTLPAGITPAELFEFMGLSQGDVLSVKQKDGMPRLDLEKIETDDIIVVGRSPHSSSFVAKVVAKNHVNVAEGVPTDNIKVSSYNTDNPFCVAFDGSPGGYSGSGFQFDSSQASSEKTDMFWIAADLGESKPIESFGIAWGTAVGQLKRRLVDGKYSVMFTDDDATWEALFTAKSKGRNGYQGYCKPEGWNLAYVQDVNDLVDANGNKLFIGKPEHPIKARYVMLAGRLSGGSVEIYNIYAFHEEEVAESPKALEIGQRIAEIRPQYPGMTLAPGRPALVQKGSDAPTFMIKANQDVMVHADLRQGDNIVSDKVSVSVPTGKTVDLDLGVKMTESGTYTVQCVIVSDRETVYDSFNYTVIDDDVAKYNFQMPYPAIQEIDGWLVYYPDYRGGHILDYSSAGYAGGGVSIPNVPIRQVLPASVDPSYDDYERIQKAVDMVGRMPLQSDGQRGTVLLGEGVFRISKPIVIDKSGIVIRGVGDGRESERIDIQPIGPDNWFDYSHSIDYEPGITKLVGLWESSTYNKDSGLIEIRGEETTSQLVATVTDQYVPAGSFSFHVDDISQIHIGDDLRIVRDADVLWAHDLHMDRITDAPGVLSPNQWVVDGSLQESFNETYQERQVINVDRESHVVTVLEPVVNALDKRYGQSFIEIENVQGRVKESGVENLQLISIFNPNSTSQSTAYGNEFKYFDDERHPQVGVYIKNAENVWVRNVSTYHIDVAVNIVSGRRMTVQDVRCLDPVSGTGGERRYSFTNSGGSMVLNQRNYARYTRHSYIVMGGVMGPNVFLYDSSDWQFDANEPHLRWSAGGLYDNVKGRIYVQNRWNNGTAHGWAGSNYVLYNCEGPYIVSQSPLAANYIIGQNGDSRRIPYVMSEVDPGNVPNYRAYEYSVGERYTPNSLYLSQLKDRLGTDAVLRAESNEVPVNVDLSEGFLSKFAFLKDLTADGSTVNGFSPDTFDYSVDIPIDSSSMPRIDAKGPRGASVSISYTADGADLMVTKKGLYSTDYKVRFNQVPKEWISSDQGAHLENLLDDNEKTVWSHSGTPVIQFYLGDTPKEISGVSLGYSRNTQSRYQYYFEFEVSDDGYNWTTVDRNEWQHDNLGNGHLMGMQLLPGNGNSRNDRETFIFPEGCRARLLRIKFYGTRFGNGSGTKNANSFWSVDVNLKD